jgi:hypothetical protein
MTRSTQIAHAVTALRNARAADNAVPEPSMKFLVFEDNCGGYQWTIVARSDDRLVQSPSFASYEEAREAARIVHAGAPSASFEHLDGDPTPTDLAARRNTRVTRDDLEVERLEAERWLDEPVSLRSEAARRWPAGR